MSQEEKEKEYKEKYRRLYNQGRYEVAGSEVQDFIQNMLLIELIDTLKQKQTITPMPQQVIDDIVQAMAKYYKS